jgi:hypothetical protein
VADEARSHGKRGKLTFGTRGCGSPSYHPYDVAKVHFEQGTPQRVTVGSTVAGAADLREVEQVAGAKEGKDALLWSHCQVRVHVLRKSWQRLTCTSYGSDVERVALVH